ncbi:MAG: iron ABC transporter permease [Desulfobacterales bacterium]
MGCISFERLKVLPRSFLSCLLLLLPLVFLALFYFYPLTEIFLLSLMPEGQWQSAVFRRIFHSAYYGRILWFTFWQAALSTVLTLVLALPGAFVFARFRFPGKKLLNAFVTVPFVLPTVVVAAAFDSLLGSEGLITSFVSLRGFSFAISPGQGIWLILAAHVFYNYSVVIRIAGGFWAQMENSLADAARMLGASPFTVFRKITFPLLGPSILASGLLVFVFCFSSFGVILILGGPGFSTIETEIYRQAVHLFNLPVAAALSLLQIVFTFALMRIYTGFQRKISVSLHPESQSRAVRKPSSLSEKIMLGANVTFMFLFLGCPLLSLLLRSLLAEKGFSLAYYTALFQNENESIFFIPPVQAVLNSLGFAGITLIMALVLGSLAAVFLAKPESRLASFLDPIFMLPLSTSAVTLGFGFILALDRPPLNLRTSLMLVPIAHTLAAFPFVVRSLLPALRSIPRNLREAASVLGANPWQVWRTVDLPIIGRALLVAAVFAFTVSLGEFGATAFTARPHTATMPLAIYRFLGQPGAMNYGQAVAMSSLLMLVTAAGFFCIEKFQPGRHREF